MSKLIIEQGDVIAIMGKGWISGLIASFTGPVSHVGIVTNQGDTDHLDTIYVTQALSTVKALTVPETMANAKYGYALHCLTLTHVQRLQMAEAALVHLGNEYAYANIFWQMMKQITGNPKWTERHDDSSPNENICSELVGLAYAIGGAPFPISPEDITPADIFHYAIQSGWLVQVLPKTASA